MLFSARSRKAAGTSIFGMSNFGSSNFGSSNDGISNAGAAVALVLLALLLVLLVASDIWSSSSQRGSRLFATDHPPGPLLGFRWIAAEHPESVEAPLCRSVLMLTSSTSSNAMQ